VHGVSNSRCLRDLIPRTRSWIIMISGRPYDSPNDPLPMPSRQTKHAIRRFTYLVLLVISNRSKTQNKNNLTYPKPIRSVEVSFDGPVSRSLLNIFFSFYKSFRWKLNNDFKKNKKNTPMSFDKSIQYGKIIYPSVGNAFSLFWLFELAGPWKTALCIEFSRNLTTFHLKLVSSSAQDC